MSWLHEIISRRECREPIVKTLGYAEFLLRRIMDRPNDPKLTLQAQFFDINTNTLLREISANDLWNWPNSQYLWIKPTGINGGIDVEYERIDDEYLSFLRNDLESRKVDFYSFRNIMRRAENGVAYSLRLNFFQSRIMYLILLAIGSALANDADGYLYTIDMDWLGIAGPLDGRYLEEQLLDKSTRVKNGLQIDVVAAQEQLDINTN